MLPTVKMMTLSARYARLLRLTDSNPNEWYISMTDLSSSSGPSGFCL
jgi:hypothetical protein